MADDFDSDDLEFPSTTENETPRRPRRAIASIIQNAAFDRIESKKALKTLKPITNSPSTAIARQYWWDLFSQFATLRIDTRANKTPTCDDVIRFISRLPSHLQSKRNDGKIAWSVIKNAEIQLDRILTWRYPNYTRSRHDSMRIEATINHLHEDGQITRDPLREAQWLTCQVIKKLATAVLINTVENGIKLEESKYKIL